MKIKDVAQIYRNLGLRLPIDIAAPTLPNKFNARKKIVDGHVFQSTLEADVYSFLKWLESTGGIACLALQVPYLLQNKFRDETGFLHRNVSYYADFQFIRAGRTVVVDAKGKKTPMYRLKRKLFQKKYPTILFEEWTRETLRRMR
jgi:hypothetical protein